MATEVASFTHVKGVVQEVIDAREHAYIDALRLVNQIDLGDEANRLRRSLQHLAQQQANAVNGFNKVITDTVEERDLARDVAARLEQENAQLEARLTAVSTSDLVSVLESKAEKAGEGHGDYAEGMEIAYEDAAEVAQLAVDEVDVFLKQLRDGAES
jgi:hypothetical protein